MPLAVLAAALAALSAGSTLGRLPHLTNRVAAAVTGSSAGILDALRPGASVVALGASAVLEAIGLIASWIVSDTGVAIVVLIAWDLLRLFLETVLQCLVCLLGVFFYLAAAGAAIGIFQLVFKLLDMLVTGQ